MCVKMRGRRRRWAVGPEKLVRTLDAVGCYLENSLSPVHDSARGRQNTTRPMNRE